MQQHRTGYDKLETGVDERVVSGFEFGTKVSYFDLRTIT